ncbi:MAG: metallophosphoesterase [Clostridiales bacterium]|nr:metallophosphoesterase [Clostridiales bacterium]
MDKQPKKKGRKLKIFLCVIAALAIVITGYFLISGWAASLPKLNYTYNTDTRPAAAYPDTAFAVISDLHVYDPSLGSSGAAFEEVLYADRKLLLDSEALLDYAIADILFSSARFVLISGDLTKDGERINHEIVAEKLSMFTETGIKVYVVPGNHDVSNPDAVAFDGDHTTPVATVTPEEFAEIYADYGYGDALYRDKNSLSYIAEPEDGLWILALDACRYKENRHGEGEIVGGKLTQETLHWIEGVLTEAIAQDKAVMALMHHGVVEHWEGQSKLHPDYLLDDYKHFGKLLASYNVRLAFTGHYHAQDITRADFGEKYLYDIETGSLITAPCPIRYCPISDETFMMQSETIVDKLYPDTDFAASAEAFVKATVVLEAYKTLKKYKVSDADADLIADAVGDAFTAHYSGDEDPALRPFLDKSKLSLWGRIVLATQKYVLDGLWKDLLPEDNNVSFSLK